MPMVCPQCSSTFAKALVCPKCRIRLNRHSTRRQVAVSRVLVPEPAAATPWSRLLVALLLAQGFYFGAKQLCMAGLLMNAEGAGAEVWTERAGPFVVLALQFTGLFLGGTLMGAGQRRAAGYGFVVGTFSGLLFLGVWRSEVPNFGSLSFVCELLSQSFFGLFSGAVGGWIWKPLAPVTLQLTDTIETTAFVAARRPLGLFSGPISWMRVGLGLGVAVAGSLSSRKLLLWLVSSTHGSVLMDDFHQFRLFVWGIMAILLLVGSMVAGSAVRNSLKQGMIVGIATTVLVIGHRFYIRSTPPVEWIMLTVGLTVATCLLGSWFGGQLLPPLVTLKRRSRCGPLS